MRAIACGAMIGALIGGTIMPHTSRAQPAPDLAHAKDLYKSAEAAIRDGRFVDAARDYGGAYEVTRDPVLFFKIGSANERAGRCDLALIYYGRYLREARPSEAFAVVTREHIVACGGDPNVDHAAGSASGSGSGAGSAEPVVTDPGAGSGSATVVGAGSDAGSAAGSGSAAKPIHVGAGDRGAWILVASSIALVTVGGVLAYAASSAESDVDDLYVGFGGQPPAFDARTKKQYEELLSEGNRYEKLSWVTFGLAGATAVGAAILFYRSSRESSLHIAPAVTPTSGSVSATLRW